MLNIEQIAIDAVKNTLNSDKLKEGLEKRIEETITSELKDFFCSYSDFGKAFEQALKDQLKLDINNLGLPEYNHFITTTIRERFDKHMEGPAINQIDNMLNQICPTTGETYKFDDILEKLRSSKEYESDHSGRFALCFKRHPESWRSEHLNIGFDKDADGGYSYLSSSTKDFDDCSCSLKVEIKTGKVVGFDMGYQGSDETAKVRTYKHDFESLLFRLYASGSVIDFGDLKGRVLEIGEGEELTGYDLDIHTDYEWASDY